MIEFRIAAYEEPVMALNPGQLKQVKDGINIPIAAGERVYTRWGFRPFFEDHIIAPQPLNGNALGAAISLDLKLVTSPSPWAIQQWIYP